MIKVTTDEITLGCKADSRAEALLIAANALINRGLVKPNFAQALLNREDETSTWVGGGVAMPHAARKNIDTVIETGYHFLQFPDGIKWERGRVAFLVVVIAAKLNEHLDVLSGIAELLSDEMQASLLSSCKTEDEFISLLE
ncbi:PTS sugar transporter subunit IIA [Pantoea rwandensis]|uniref:PTS EIIA type-2 domain-containing protein n=1 Tax=Pantoea rwandensis TaxID=1076550 RepID=A0A1X1D3B0_9GAMM|nr:PTS sugar transporter subunit IIA [Pantoea rwandensis]ORM71070.1 hypothetical protein HA51_04045 [Pantoea rwandensis]